MGVTVGHAFKYALLPGIIPRIFAFLSSGFSHIAFYMAHVYRSVRLLPDGHAYLNPANAGKYGIRHVVFEAKRHLVFSRENIDQIIIFFALLAGIIVLFMQFALLIGGLFAAPANAGMGAYYASFFVTQQPEYDLAFRLLDLTFGFEDPYKIFNSCAINEQPCQLAFQPGGGYTVVKSYTPTIPSPFHLALHGLFHFYNMGVLVVAFMIAMYMFTTIVAETAQSGTPFGRRFNGMWAPIRLVVAIALLTPLAFGMNGAQLVTLVVAKWGSGLATNGWTAFANTLTHMPIQREPAAPESLVARPNPPQANPIIEFTFVALTCKHSEALLNRRGEDGKPEIQAWQVFEPQAAAGGGGGGGGGGAAQGRELMTNGGFTQALENARNGDIVIRFGAEDDVNYQRYSGHVKPICGEIVFNTKDVHQPGAFAMQEAYYNLVYALWTDAPNDQRARNIALRYMPVASRDPFASPIPDLEYVASTIRDFQEIYMIPDIDEARQEQVNAEWSENYLPLGWVGAGMWYQKIAEYTGSLFSSVYGMPTASRYPAVMEHVKEQRRMQNDFVEGMSRFNPVLSNGSTVEFEDDRDEQMAQAYYYAQQFWWPAMVQPSSNTFVDTILSIFGLNGLYNMHKNLDIHPLAQLVGVGRSLIESAVTNLGFSFGSGVIGGIANILGRDLVGSVALAASSFAGQVAVIGLSIGFILYYIVPFLPFIYFFFAAGGWVKGIFEAMVGLPLWAMAHIRIDGEGLPGPAAMNGYFLIFEILIRPILIVAGLIGGISIFTAQVQILNEIWQLVTSSVGGFNAADATAAAPTAAAGTGAGVGPVVGSIEYLRNAADELFHTIMYAIIVYMMAMSSFKLIDLIPNNILRWLGSSVSTFGDHSGDPAQTLVQHSFMGSQMAMGPLNKAIQGIASRARPGN